MLGRPVILRADHDDEGDIPDYHAAVWLGDSVIRDRAGRPHRHAGTRFARVICNNPGCGYEALVNAEIVAYMASVQGHRGRWRP
jgi:hypothetical protein